ncbi:hypothetical protein CKJ90_33080, partial [Klebsiella pneumoniae]
RDGGDCLRAGLARGETNLLLERLYIERSLSVNSGARDGGDCLRAGLARGETNLLLERLYIERSLSVN